MYGIWRCELDIKKTGSLNKQNSREIMGIFYFLCVFNAWHSRYKTMHVLKMRDFWNIAPCILVGIDRRFRDAYCLHQPDEGSTHLWNVGILQRDYTALYPTRLYSYSPPWEPEVSYNACPGCNLRSSVNPLKHSGNYTLTHPGTVLHTH
jgi:hypothetical protein